MRLAANLDTRHARRDLRRAERAVLTAERRAMLRAAGNVRRMEVALVRGRRSKAAGGAAVAPLDKRWRELLHPRLPMGGALGERKHWRISAPRPGVAVVDIVPGLQPLLHRWEFGGGGREAILRRDVWDWAHTPAGRREYHGWRVPHGWPPSTSMLPAVAPQPRREVKRLAENYARPRLGDWYVAALQKILNRGS